MIPPVSDYSTCDPAATKKIVSDPHPLTCGTLPMEQDSECSVTPAILFAAERNMAQTTKDIYIVGLRNAHAMEIQARELMERQSERTNDYPDVKMMLTKHLTETNDQLARLERCLTARGEDSSSLKDTAQSLAANVTALFHSAADDEILKNTFANNAFENFEIAAYKSLITLAEAAGCSGDTQLLKLSLAEEQNMADWVDANVEKVTTAYLRHATS
jgi:ferritin-like metal-binding protein YciE